VVKKAKVELVGIEDVEMILNKLPGKFQAKVIAAALKEAGKPMIDEAKRSLESAPYGAGLSRFTKMKARRVKGIPGVEIGQDPPKRGKRSKLAWRAMGPYWLEFGTMENMTKPREPGTRPLSEAKRRVGTGRRGRIPAFGWLRKAVDKTEKIVEKNYRDILWGVLNKKLLSHAKKIKWSGLH